jgi:hypothetical protein
MAFTFQATGNETEIFDERDDDAKPVVLVPFLDSETPDQHQARVRTIVDAMNGTIASPPDASRNSDLRKLALRAIAANRIVAATNVSDLEDDGSIFESIHDKANDLTIDTQRALARRIGWLVGSDGMADDISPVGREVFDQLTHGIASDRDIVRAFNDATGQDLAPALADQDAHLLVQTDDKGYVTLHEPDEDGNPGDLVASVWRDDWLESLRVAKRPEA